MCDRGRSDRQVCAVIVAVVVVDKVLEDLELHFFATERKASDDTWKGPGPLPVDQGPINAPIPILR